MGVPGVIKSAVPVSAKRRLRRVQESTRRQVRRPFTQPVLRKAIADLVATAPALPTDAQLRQLEKGWDNPAAGDLDYLRVVLDLCQRADGPILECGSGLTTFLLGAYATQPVWTLEADERWHARVSGEARAAGIAGARIVHAPLRDYGEFFWYELPEGLPEQFGLVVCDGPAAGGLKGGRMGLMPMVGERITSGAAIVVDRGMVHERVAVEVWERDYGLVAEDTTTPYRVYRTP